MSELAHFSFENVLQEERIHICRIGFFTTVVELHP